MASQHEALRCEDCENDDIDTIIPVTTKRGDSSIVHVMKCFYCEGLAFPVYPEINSAAQCTSEIGKDINASILSQNVVDQLVASQNRVKSEEIIWSSEGVTLSEVCFENETNIETLENDLSEGMQTSAKSVTNITQAEDLVRSLNSDIAVIRDKASTIDTVATDTPLVCEVSVKTAVTNKLSAFEMKGSGEDVSRDGELPLQFSVRRDQLSSYEDRPTRDTNSTSENSVNMKKATVCEVTRDRTIASEITAYIGRPSASDVQDRLSPSDILSSIDTLSTSEFVVKRDGHSASSKVQPSAFEDKGTSNTLPASETTPNIDRPPAPAVEVTKERIVTSDIEANRDKSPASEVTMGMIRQPVSKTAADIDMSSEGEVIRERISAVEVSDSVDRSSVTKVEFTGGRLTASYISANQDKQSVFEGEIEKDGQSTSTITSSLDRQGLTREKLSSSEVASTVATCLNRSSSSESEVTRGKCSAPETAANENEPSTPDDVEAKDMLLRSRIEGGRYIPSASEVEVTEDRWSASEIPSSVDKSSAFEVEVTKERIPSSKIAGRRDRSSVFEGEVEKDGQEASTITGSLGIPSSNIPPSTDILSASEVVIERNALSVSKTAAGIVTPSESEMKLAIDKLSASEIIPNKDKPSASDIEDTTDRLSVLEIAESESLSVPNKDRPLASDIEVAKHKLSVLEIAESVNKPSALRIEAPRDHDDFSASAAFVDRSSASERAAHDILSTSRIETSRDKPSASEAAIRRDRQSASEKVADISMPSSADEDEVIRDRLPAQEFANSNDGSSLSKVELTSSRLTASDIRAGIDEDSVFQDKVEKEGKSASKFTANVDIPSATQVETTREMLSPAGIVAGVDGPTIFEVAVTRENMSASEFSDKDKVMTASEAAERDAICEVGATKISLQTYEVSVIDDTSFAYQTTKGKTPAHGSTEAADSSSGSKIQFTLNSQTVSEIAVATDSSSEGCYIDHNLTKCESYLVEDGKCGPREVVLFCKGCCNVHRDTFVIDEDKKTGRRRIVCGWCDWPIDIDSPYFHDEQQLLARPCSCGNQSVDKFCYIFDFQEQGIIQNKVCEDCGRCLSIDNFDDGNHASDIGNHHVNGKMQIKERLCPKCDNDDLLKFKLAERESDNKAIGIEVFIYCEVCASKIPLDEFGRITRDETSAAAERADGCLDIDMNFIWCECFDKGNEPRFKRYCDSNGTLNNIVCEECFQYVPFYSEMKTCGELRIDDIHLLRPGDIIKHKDVYGRDNFAVVVSVLHQEASLNHSKSPNSILISKNDKMKGPHPSAFAVKEEKYLDCSKDQVFRIEYSSTDCFMKDDVINRAKELCAEGTYKKFPDAESFITWCKIKKRVKRGNDTGATKGHKERSQKKRSSASEFMKNVVNSVASDKGVQDEFVHLTGEAFGGIPAVSLRAVFSLARGYCAHKNMKNGKISKEEFQAEIKSCLADVTKEVRSRGLRMSIPVLSNLKNRSVGDIMAFLYK